MEECCTLHNYLQCQINRNSKHMIQQQYNTNNQQQDFQLVDTVLAELIYQNMLLQNLPSTQKILSCSQNCKNYQQKQKDEIKYLDDLISIKLVLKGQNQNQFLNSILEQKNIGHIEIISENSESIAIQYLQQVNDLQNILSFNLKLFDNDENVQKILQNFPKINYLKQLSLTFEVKNLHFNNHQHTQLQDFNIAQQLIKIPQFEIIQYFKFGIFRKQYHEFNSLLFNHPKSVEFFYLLQNKLTNMQSFELNIDFPLTQQDIEKLADAWQQSQFGQNLYRLSFSFHAIYNMLDDNVEYNINESSSIFLLISKMRYLQSLNISLLDFEKKNIINQISKIYPKKRYTQIMNSVDQRRIKCYQLKLMIPLIIKVAKKQNIRLQKMESIIQDQFF